MVGDFNGDGKPDLAVANFVSGNVSVLLGRGDGTFQTAVNFGIGSGSQPQFVAVGDFNGDGKPDLAVANASGGWDISVLLNTCTSAGIDLAVARSNSTVTVSWPLPSTGFVLESTTSLGLTNWQPAAETVVTNSGRLEVLVPLDRTERYFRLRGL